MKINDKNRVNPITSSESVRNNAPPNTPQRTLQNQQNHAQNSQKQGFGTHASVKLSLPALRQTLIEKLHAIGGKAPTSLSNKSPNKTKTSPPKISAQAKAAQAAYGRALRDSETIDRRASVISWPDGMENEADPQRPYKEALFLLDVLDRGHVNYVTIHKDEAFDAAIKRTLKEHKFDTLLPPEMQPKNPKI